MTIILLLLILSGFYLLSILPRMKNRPDNSALKGFYYAHRGLHDNYSDAPENSLLSIQRAVDYGYGIEFDVQLTKDEKVVVFHDESLQRVCGQTGNVRDYTYEELLNFSLLDSSEKIPLLTEVLSIVDKKVPLIIEIKIHENIQKICTRVDMELSHYNGPYAIESFHPLAVTWYKKNRPDIIRGQLSSNLLQTESGGSLLEYFIVQNLLTNFIAKPDFIAYDYKYKHALSFYLCKKLFHSLSVAWTIKSQASLTASEADFDLFIFEGFIPDIK